jgi:hypothetical protein
MSTFIGLGSGIGATEAHYSTFIGPFAGNSAINAEFSTFIGSDAGAEATNASSSIFIGNEAGLAAENARGAIFIGNQAGKEDTVSTSLGFWTDSILIGNNTSTGGYTNSIALGAQATNTAQNQLMIGSSSYPIDEMIFNGGTGATCSFIITGGGISCSSDERLKTNITDLASSTLDDLMNIRTVTFNWKDGVNDKTQIGFIAQNINEYFSELVTVNRDGMLAVNYAGMAPVLVKAVQEMNFQLITIDNIETPNSFRDALIRWFGNVSNGITEFIAGTIRAKDQLCIDDVCINKGELQQILNGQGTNNSGGSTSPSEGNGDNGESSTSGTMTSDIGSTSGTIDVINGNDGINPDTGTIPETTENPIIEPVIVPGVVNEPEEVIPNPEPVQSSVPDGEVSAG